MQRELPVGRKGTTSWQAALGKGQAHLAEDISMKGDILISRANMGHAHLLPLNRRQGPIQEGWVSDLHSQAEHSLFQQFCLHCLRCNDCGLRLQTYSCCRQLGTPSSIKQSVVFGFQGVRAS